MKELNLTAAEYNQRVRLGYFTPTKCISVFKKEVIHNLFNGVERLTINLIKSA